MASKLTIDISEAYEPKLNLTEAARGFAKLQKEVTEAGILDRAYVYYSLLIPITIITFFLSIYMLITVDSLIATAFWVIPFMLSTIQVGGLFHDASHKAIFNTPTYNDIVGYITGSFLGVSFKNWKINHNKHHANPNNEDEDPDFKRPFLSFSQKNISAKKGIQRFLAKYQAYFYIPTTFFSLLFWQMTTVPYFKKAFKKTVFWEIVLYVIGISAWLILPFVFLESAKLIVIYLVIYPLAGFYLYNLFAPNHKGMPIIEKDTKISFLEKQIVTSRTMPGNVVFEFLFVGLNYQIEHHLFPSCPRNKLKLLTPYIKKVCREVGLPYAEESLVESNKIIFSTLNRIALSA